MMCGCIQKLDGMLAPQNTRLVTTLFGNPPRVVLRTEQVETGRGKAKAAHLLATFCPFCGDRYVKPEEADNG